MAKRIINFIIILTAIILLPGVLIPELNHVNADSYLYRNLTDGDYAYNVLSDGTAEIYGYYGDPGDIVIPSTIGGYKVSTISFGGSYTYSQGVTGITVSDGITTIGNSGFEYCISATKIVLPESIACWSIR